MGRPAVVPQPAHEATPRQAQLLNALDSSTGCSQLEQHRRLARQYRSWHSAAFSPHAGHDAHGPYLSVETARIMAVPLG